MPVTAAPPSTAAHDRVGWLGRFKEVRGRSAALTAPLSAEDQQIQSMPDVSPTKWHLAHTSWFFETFILLPHAIDYTPFDPQFGYLFNSYYEAVGERLARPSRGLLSRPALDQVLDYRAHVDQAMDRLIGAAPADSWAQICPLLDLGLHHDQQHQELILMDIKHVFSLNPTAPAYGEPPLPLGGNGVPLDWLSLDGGLVEIGHDGEGFAFDNEGPRHKVWLEPFLMASRPISSGEYAAFIDDGGYRRPELWLSEGWAAVQREGWQAPLYWRPLAQDGSRSVFTLSGLRPLDTARPVCHLSFFEADAYARWLGKRLPTEAEWEAAAQSGAVHQRGEVWEWTASAYSPYPRFRAPPGALGEYNGKFMSGQMVLRGGCAATPKDHMRLTYRNFFPPSARWAFSGLRLADDA